MSKAQLMEEQKSENKRIAAQRAADTRARKKSEAEAQNKFAGAEGGVSTLEIPGESVMKMSAADKAAKLLDIQLQTALLNQDAAEEDNRKRRNDKKQKALQNAQRQSQMASERGVRLRAAAGCNHRQGGTMTMGFSASKGRGATALNRIILPDSRLIMCNAGCGLRMFSPHPYDQSTNQRTGESMDQMMQRVEKYHMDSARFEELWERAETEAFTPESAQIMDCGVTVKFLDKHGYEVLVRRQCDNYALKM